MSFNFISDFQLKLHNILSDSPEIKQNISKIYTSIVQDGKCPFLLINITQIKNLSISTKAIYSVEFEICIFVKEDKKHTLTLIADTILKLLTVDNCYFGEYMVAGIRCSQISFDKAKDLITNKLTMNYHALLKARGHA